MELQQSSRIPCSCIFRNKDNYAGQIFTFFQKQVRNLTEQDNLYQWKSDYH